MSDFAWLPITSRPHWFSLFDQLSRMFRSLLLSLSYNTLNISIVMDSPILSDRTANTYESLPGPDCIRLLHLEPALHADAPLRFSFQTAQLAKAVAQYEVISYIWGEPKLIHPLYVDDGTHVLVTKDLDKALRRLRHPTTVRILWADAVCINQVDNEEKSTQIPLMARIFRGASKVLAWLDDGADEERGLLLLEQLSRYQDPEYKDGDEYENEDEDEDGDEELGDKELPDSYARDDNILIHKFLSLAWFTRLWIIQEIVMNADVILFCGTSSMTWVRFSEAFSNYLYLQPQGTRLVDLKRLEVLRNITRVWAQHNLPGLLRSRSVAQESIVDLVETFSGYGCADPRDHIFALYSMTQDIQPSNYLGSLRCVRMDVNYSASIREVYQEFASACIATSRMVLDAVLARQYTSGSDEIWPSWVPDWRKPPSTRFQRPSTEELSCDKVAHSTIKIWPVLMDRHHRENFPVVDHIFAPPETIDDPINFLVSMCREWAHFALSDMLRVVLPHKSEFEREAFAEHITKICEDYPTYDISTRDAQMSLDLRSTLQYHRFFSAINYTHPRTSSTATRTKADRVIFGYGNAAMAKGDKVISLDLHSRSKLIDDPQRNYAFLFRQSASRTRFEHDFMFMRDTSMHDVFTHKLIGSTFIMNPDQLKFSRSCPYGELYID
jgi:hypothetical protein